MVDHATHGLIVFLRGLMTLYMVLNSSYSSNTYEWLSKILHEEMLLHGARTKESSTPSI